MPNFRDPEGGLHFLSDEDIANGGQSLLPTGSAEVSAPEEAVITLAQAQLQKMSDLTAAYAAAIAQPVSFTTSAGVTKTYQADPTSVNNLAYMRAAYPTQESLPAGFYWKSSDNSRVPFTIADMAGLAKVMGDQGFAAFDHLDAKKNAVLAATTVEQVAGVTW
jgi:hypothetical protein